MNHTPIIERIQLTRYRFPFNNVGYDLSSTLYEFGQVSACNRPIASSPADRPEGFLPTRYRALMLKNTRPSTGAVPVPLLLGKALCRTAKRPSQRHQRIQATAGSVQSPGQTNARFSSKVVSMLLMKHATISPARSPGHVEKKARGLLTVACQACPLKSVVSPSQHATVHQILPGHGWPCSDRHPARGTRHQRWNTSHLSRPWDDGVVRLQSPRASRPARPLTGAKWVAGTAQ